ncbi:WecB/TagA/CpsF family glycosyltransferase [Ideonella sp. 4Y11]|uniref:WecB/TagA/CpsF family glycosyltransferase n=1 Tax=Ideonella aquatica TaxID=2824119 RepID=A0A941BKH8_9BURK|nr:WecB/TagA/CpsF family glycosyltransferase [Ideonella aquatica]MBQ0959923.1 WecB/TagA/CpsF family glycosyltransferase [Ideonella aquatica]
MKQLSGLAGILPLVKGAVPNWEELVDQASARQRAVLITFVNPLSVRTAKLNQAHIKHLHDFDYVFADGILMAKVCSLVEGREVTRISFDGNSIATDVLMWAGKTGRKVAFVGGAEGIAAEAGRILQGVFDLKIVSTRSGYFDGREQRGEYCRKLVASDQPELVVCGMGAPFQEEFLLDLRASGYNALAFTCGGYFDQVVESKSNEYYPRWVNRWNIRALYRLYKEPARLWRRYTVQYLPFLAQALILIIIKPFSFVRPKR